MKKIKDYTYHSDTQVVCACGVTFTTGSIKKTMQVDICSKCHPFYTGEMKYVDTQGRVEKFMNKRQKSDQLKEKISKKTRSLKKSSDEQKTLREMLQKT
ncbi:50S ribosomal protein L31 [Patescibacteria group bacterium]|nr:50S ribosomal protein L31 [Patescibacteria group bacterium]